MNFRDIPGQEEVKKTLTQALKQNHLAHALLIRSDDGGAALSVAIAFANFMLCPNRTETDACGDCDTCSKTKKLIHPDFHFVLPYKSLSEKDEDQGKAEMMAHWRSLISENFFPTLRNWASHAEIESKQISISVKESRRILYNVALKPFEAEKKIIFIWLPELLGIEAANALLKVLEEPNQRTQFLLIAHDYEKILPTILSRTQLISVRRFTENQISSTLTKDFGTETEKAEQIARLAEGNMNAARELIHGMPDNNLALFQNWFRLCYGQKMVDLVFLSEEFQNIGKEPQKNLLQFGLSMLRESLIWNYGNAEQIRLTAEEKSFMSNFSKVIQANKVDKISQWINESYYQIERNVNPKMVFLDLSIQISKIIKA